MVAGVPLTLIIFHTSTCAANNRQRLYFLHTKIKTKSLSPIVLFLSDAKFATTTVIECTTEIVRLQREKKIQTTLDSVRR